jgi:hypothetical protein
VSAIARNKAALLAHETSIASSQVSMTQDWTYRDIALPAVTSAEGVQQTNTIPSTPGPSRLNTNHPTPSQCPDERKGSKKGSSPFGSPTTVKVKRSEKEPFDKKESNLKDNAHRLNFEVVPETPSPAKYVFSTSVICSH